MSSIVVLKDQTESSSVLTESLERLKHSVTEVQTLAELHRFASNNTIDAIFVDRFADNKKLLKALKEIAGSESLRATPLIVVTAEANADEVIEVMKLGAFDHLNAPVPLAELDSAINRAVGKPKQQDSPALQNQFVGTSSSMRQVEKLIGMAATSHATVLITGETGSGKDTVARAIHNHSTQQKAPLTVIDCTAVPEDYGSFQSLAEGSSGTIILDEIGDLNQQMQAMLVRALKEISPAAAASEQAPRIIASTQYDLIGMVKEKQFREDLYYRLNVLPIHLPPLRERGADILSLAEVFLQQANPLQPKRLSSSAAKVLLDHEWPGNVRELENLMYHLSVVVRAAVIESTDLQMLNLNAPETNSEDNLDYYSAVATLEKRLLIRALMEAKGSRTEAAKLLGINRQLLYAKLKTHGLEERT